jgi:hypothetical protein
MSFPLKDGNQSFPSDAGPFLESLDKGEAECDGINVENENLGILLSSNPVAAAATFIRLLRCVWKHLFGLQMEDEIARTVSQPSRVAGIFNDVYGCNSIIETQDRDFGLHTHGVLWTNLSPLMMTCCASVPALREKVCQSKYFYNNM